MLRVLPLLLSMLLLPALAACDAGLDGQAAALLASTELPVRDARRCPHCGWIESKREILPEVVDPLVARIYEYTLRRADGSSSIFQEALPTTWRVRERVMVIEGSAHN